MTEEEYIEHRLDRQVRWFDSKSVLTKRIFLTMRTMEITAATFIPLLSGMATSLGKYYAVIIGTLGAAVAIIASLQSLHHFQERWVENRAIAERLRSERFLFLTRVEPYQGDEAFSKFVKRCESIIKRHTARWTQEMSEQRSGIQSADIKSDT